MSSKAIIVETEFQSLDITIDAILPSAAFIKQLIGYQNNQIPGFFAALIEKALDEAAKLCQPAAGFRILAVAADEQTGRLRLGTENFKPGPIITRRLGQSQLAVVFICTIGQAFTERSSQLMQRGDSVEAYIIDSVASAAAEGLAEQVHQQLAKIAAAEAWGVSERFSPGYCGWPVAEQSALFSLLPEGACGITLAASGMMIPLKSVSGVFGFGPGLSRRPYHCARCDKLDCPSRQVNN